MVCPRPNALQKAEEIGPSLARFGERLLAQDSVLLVDVAAASFNATQLR